LKADTEAFENQSQAVKNLRQINFRDNVVDNLVENPIDNHVDNSNNLGLFEHIRLEF